MERVMAAKEKGRRTFLKLATAGSLTAAGVLRPTVTHAQHSVPNSAGTEAPRTEAPATAADCHIHIYDAHFKSAVPALPGATVQDYRLLQKRIGTSRVVDDAVLFDLLAVWAPVEATRNRLLVTNPEALYRF